MRSLESPTKLALFDIDGTLVHCGGRTRRPLANAMEETYGTAGSLLDDSFAGKTDDQIVFDALLSAGLGENEISASLPAAKRRYIEELEKRLDGDGIEVLPGVRETLERLEDRPSVRVGLLTGNWKAGARWKLEHSGLSRYFAFGAFGDGRRDRSELPPVALAAAADLFDREFPPADVLIVGDTPNDVRCARENGLRALVLTTGFSSRAELEEAGADWVFSDLVEAGHLLPMLGEPVSPGMDLP